ncbi:cell division cycle-associated protein 2 isoform X3 [Plectropomus leopardus]|uniref:cell division cycle-associated protein 2 isoform X3 n=1 Tax=Plectropomus leopardus TaxID=160734 RepID=UPI001C4C6BB8|nr:cell division cycle-associated protein 2 isoform X3 [Plectropomus leopardus]
MATVEMTTDSTEGDQERGILSPSVVDSTPVLNDFSAPLNFSELTPCQFGISVQSFAPASSSNRKDKSRLAQIKARRRSNIGVRGSPETNSLIRFMAQQRMKTPQTPKTPELVRSSPFLPRVASTLRQKMASFQSLMDVEESEVCDLMPRQDSNTGGCIKTRDYLSDGNSSYEGKENHPPVVTPVPSKRRRLGLREGCEVEIREAGAPIPHLNLKEQQEEEPVTQGPLPSSETVGEAQAVLISPTLHTDFELQACSPARTQQGSVFEHQSFSQPPPDDSAAASPTQPARSSHIPSLPSLLETKPTGEDDSTGMSAVKKKKKRVHFGGPLSPEFFDKNLPPSTPLQKGGTPARAPTPGGSLLPRSVLKTPQRSESQTPQAQLDLRSPTVFGASPTLAMPRNRRMQSVEEDREEKDGKIFFPTMEEIDSAVTGDTECTWVAQPLNLDTAFHEESLSHILTESETPSATSQMDALDEPTSMPEKEKQHEADVEAPAQSRSRRKKQSEPEQTCTSEAPARSSSRKRKQPESEPVKRSTRSAAKSASGKMKIVFPQKTSTAARRWNRDVDRTLYGSRAYASKNPALSPITEALSLTSQSPATQKTLLYFYTPNDDTHLNSEIANDTQAVGDLTVTNDLENSSGASVTSPNLSKDGVTVTGRRQSGPRVRGGRLKKRKVSVTDDVQFSEVTLDQTGGQTEEHCEDQTTTNREESGETPLNRSVSQQKEVDTGHDAQTSADACCTDSDGKSECHDNLDAPTSDCPSPIQESNSTFSLPAEPAQKKGRRGRRSSAISSELQEQGNQAEEHQTSHEVKEEAQGEQAASQQENNIRSSSDSQEEGAAELAPWQADFNFEDVFKPVATRGQRSVRRSLRNQSNAELSSNSAGLAWLPRTSPDSSKEARRRTRGRRLSAAPPVQPPLPEETQDSSS